jgi:hypothetical protein
MEILLFAKHSRSVVCHDLGKEDIMQRIAIVLLVGLACYIAGGLLGYTLVMRLSSNVHDRAMEAAISGAFFVGPLAALIGALVAFSRRWRCMSQ